MKKAKLGNCCWFTNLTVNKTNTLILTKSYTPEEYPKYDNSDTINVDKIKDIPVDYNDVMGVPITFIQSHNVEQFELIGLANDRDTIIKDRHTYKRLLIKKVI